MRQFLTTWLVLATLGTSLSAQNLVFKGSDTLGDKLVPQLITQFEADCQCKLPTEVHAQGSSEAFTALLDGSAEIGMSSRPIKDAEKAKLDQAGLAVEEHVACIDMIAVIVNQANTAENVSLDAIEKIFTSSVANWKTVAGGAEVKPYTRNEKSGTYKVFQEMAMSGKDYGATAVKSEGNAEIVEHVAAERGGVGYVGLSYAEAPGVKTVTVEGVAPSPKNAATYPLARKLYFYTIKGKESADATRFIQWVKTNPVAAKTITEAGFIPTGQ